MLKSDHEVVSPVFSLTPHLVDEETEMGKDLPQVLPRGGSRARAPQCPEPLL
jgi:hypothetical protein